jgi:hypothetical protein
MKNIGSKPANKSVAGADINFMQIKRVGDNFVRVQEDVQDKEDEEKTNQHLFYWRPFRKGRIGLCHFVANDW